MTIKLTSLNMIILLLCIEGIEFDVQPIIFDILNSKLLPKIFTQIFSWVKRAMGLSI